MWFIKCGKQNSTTTNSTKKEICVFLPCGENLVLNPNLIPSAPTKCSVSGSDSCQNHFLCRRFSFSLYYWQKYITASSEYSSNTNSCASWRKRRIRHVKIAGHWISWLFLYGDDCRNMEHICQRTFFAEQGKREWGNAHPQKKKK